MDHCCCCYRYRWPTLVPAQILVQRRYRSIAVLPSLGIITLPPGPPGRSPYLQPVWPLPLPGVRLPTAALGCFCGLKAASLASVGSVVSGLRSPHHPTDNLAFHLNKGRGPLHDPPWTRPTSNNEPPFRPRPRPLSTPNSLHLSLSLSLAPPTLILTVTVTITHRPPSCSLHPVTARRPPSVRAVSHPYPRAVGANFESAAYLVPPTPRSGLPQRLPDHKIDNPGLPQVSSHFCRLSLYAFYCALEPSIWKTCQP
jgi:hypothetical protein